jgi:hypothetical protein
VWCLVVFVGGGLFVWVFVGGFVVCVGCKCFFVLVCGWVFVGLGVGCWFLGVLFGVVFGVVVFL